MPKAFIYGSCVARDTMNFFPPEWGKPTYIARQSMISGTTGKAPLDTKNALESAFQNRMVQYDIHGVAHRRLKARLTDHDLVLLDLVDERRGVFEVAPGKYVTHSNEMVRTRLLKQQATTPRLIDFGTDEHWELWAPAARRIVHTINESGRPAFLLAPPWASVSNEGTEVTWRGQPVPEMNKKYEPYIQHIVDLGMPLVTVPEDEALGDEYHKWMLNAFHYVEDVYTNMRDQILDRIK